MVLGEKKIVFRFKVGGVFRGREGDFWFYRGEGEKRELVLKDCFVTKKRKLI